MSFEEAVPLEVVAGVVRALEVAEQRLFELCGRWAADGDEPAARVFFSSQSALHAWRAEEWRRRRPRSALLEGGSADGSLLPAGWEPAVARAEALEADVARVAVWLDLLVPALLNGMRRGGSGLGEVADAGLRRLVRLFGDDLLEQWAAGQALLAQLATPPSAAAAAAGAIGELLPVLWARE
jgi:hypothetical protein